MTKEQLQELEKELIKKEAVERKTRSEQARQRIEEIKQREIEEVSIFYMQYSVALLICIVPDFIKFTKGTTF